MSSLRKKRGRPGGPKTRNGGQWTEARFMSFIKSALRGASRKWNPISVVQKEARTSRGMYKCASCQNNVPNTIKVGRKRKQNVFVDHIEPVVDPKTGFTNWEDYINRLFSEKNNLQLLCGECHDKKSMNERALTAKYNKERKENE
jgi:hypothetical protein